MFDFLSDTDSFIRETNIKILGLIGYKKPIVIVDVLINKALVDEEWSVREAAVSSLGNIVTHIENKEDIIKKLVSLLDGEQSWVRRSALNILSKIEEVDETYIPFNSLTKCLTSSDSKVREASASLLFIYSSQINEIFDKIIERKNFTENLKMKASNIGILLASGLIAGEAITGVLLAILVIMEIKLINIMENPWLGLAVFVVVVYILIRIPYKAVMKTE